MHPTYLRKVALPQVVPPFRSLLLKKNNLPKDCMATAWYTEPTPLNLYTYLSAIFMGLLIYGAITYLFKKGPHFIAGYVLYAILMALGIWLIRVSYRKGKKTKQDYQRYHQSENREGAFIYL